MDRFEKNKSKVGLLSLVIALSFVLVGCRDNSPVVENGLPTGPIQVGETVRLDYSITGMGEQGLFDYYNGRILIQSPDVKAIPALTYSCTTFIKQCDLTFDQPGVYEFWIYSRVSDPYGFYHADYSDIMTIEVVEGPKATTETFINSITPTTPAAGEEVTVEVSVVQDQVSGVAMEEKIRGEIQLSVNAPYTCGTMNWTVICKITFENPGSYLFTASYVPEAGFVLEGSTSLAETVTVSDAPEATTDTFIKSVSPTSATVGEEVVVEVSVVQARVPGVAMEEKIRGEIQLSVNAPYTCGTMNWTVICKIRFDSPGNYLFTASYVPEAGFVLNGSTSLAETVSVTDALTTTTMIDRVISPNLSVKGETATFFVSVVSNGTTLPMGTVTVTGAGGSCTATLDSSGQGNCAYQMNTVGQFTITATYNGDTDHLGSEGTISYGVVEPTLEPPKDEGCNDPNDSDCDGVNNFTDECPGTAKGVSVGETGCP